MFQQGWTDGYGLGSKSQGLPVLDLWQHLSKGKASDDRRGIGYSGPNTKNWDFCFHGSKDPELFVKGRIKPNQFISLK